MAEQKGEKLFSDFPSVSKSEWKEKVIADLKGADFDRKLVWKTLEGFDLQPYYDSSDLEELKYLQGAHEALAKPDNYNKWLNCVEVDAQNASDANKEAVDALLMGAEAITFVNVNSADVEVLLSGIDLSKTYTGFKTSDPLKVAHNVVAALDVEGIAKDSFRGNIVHDPISNFALEGTWHEEDKDTLESLLSITKDWPGLSVINVSSSPFYNAGSNVSQELAYTLNAYVEYLDMLTERQVRAEEIIKKSVFNLSLGNSYFFEIAKIRVFRMMLQQIATSYNVKDVSPYDFTIHSHSSEWTKTLYDPYVNMLRNTTEAMAGIIGGCDLITIDPYNATFELPNRQAKRISRNISTILKEESYLDKNMDPAGGSYYIENITHQLLNSAGKLFKDIEAAGGFFKAFESGTIQEAIDEVRAKKEAGLSTRKVKYVGSNIYPNITEEVVPEKVVRKMASSKSQVKTLMPQSGASEIEALRFKTDKFVEENGKASRPLVYLSKIGSNAAMKSARATFSTGFMGCAGFHILEGDPLKSLNEAVDEAIDNKAQFVVLCGADDDYPTVGVEFTKAVKAKAPGTTVIVAGNPVDDIEALKAAGIDDFIHVRSNLLQTLSSFQTRVNIK